MSDRSTVVANPSGAQWVYDPAHDTLDFLSGPSATVDSYSLAAGAFTSTIAIGGSLGPFAISPDGRDLFIEHGAAPQSGVPETVTRVDLASGVVDQIQAPAAYAGESGSGHIAVDGAGNVIFGAGSTQVGVNGFKTFLAEAPTPSAHADDALAILARTGSVEANSYILASPSHRFLVFEDPNNSGAWLAVYDSESGGVVATSPFGAGAFQKGLGDATDGGMVVDVTYTTMTGGTGADTFHAFSGAGLDIVTDFNAAQGDRVQLDAGTTYALTQQGSDVAINMGNGDELILKNVQLSTLPQAWIFSA
jgi:hypothetical protein